MIILIRFLKAAVFFLIGAMLVLATVALMAAESPGFPPGPGTGPLDPNHFKPGRVHLTHAQPVLPATVPSTNQNQ